MAPRRGSDYRTLASLSRINLLHELQQHGSQTITELAAATGLHHNTAREHLHRLVDAGFVDSETIPSHSKGRPRIRYRAAQGVDSPALRVRRELSERRTELMHKLIPMNDVFAPAPDAREFDALDDHMEECGIDADFNSTHTRMVMHDCPFSYL
ncbi:MAG: helix-turn-helix domain-containing protein, partial [Rhodoglobus sp.]|nr:helix-turn-helix domain-containing protein [Rhodoglobus sp.]